MKKSNDRKKFIKDFLPTTVDKVIYGEVQVNGNIVSIKDIDIVHEEPSDDGNGGTRKGGIMTEEKVVEIIKREVPPMIETSINNALKSFETNLFNRLETFLDKKLDEKLDKKLDEKLEEKLDKKLDEKLKPIENRLDNIEKRLDVIEKDIQDIKNCPTVKKELDDNDGSGGDE